MNSKNGIQQKCNYMLCKNFNNLEKESWQHDVIGIEIPSAYV